MLGKITYFAVEEDYLCQFHRTGWKETWITVRAHIVVASTMDVASNKNPFPGRDVSRK